MKKILSAILSLSIVVTVFVSIPNKVEAEGENAPHEFRADEFYDKLDGSTVTEPISAKFAEDLTKIDLSHHNKTDQAIKNVIDGKKDLALVTYPSEENLAYAGSKGVTLVIIPIVNDAFVFTVNEQNPIGTLTQAQIKSIYNKQFTTWSNFGWENPGGLTFGESNGIFINEVPIPDGPLYIKAVIRNKTSGSQSGMTAFMGHELDENQFSGDVVSAMGALIDVIALDPRAIGYSYLYYVNSMYYSDNKVLAIDGVAPTNENIQNGSYPITCQYYAVFKSTETENSFARAFTKELLSKSGQQKLEDLGYVKLGQNQIQELPSAGNAESPNNITRTPSIKDICENVKFSGSLIYAFGTPDQPILASDGYEFLEKYLTYKYSDKTLANIVANYIESESIDIICDNNRIFANSDLILDLYAPLGEVPRQGTRLGYNKDNYTQFPLGSYRYYYGTAFITYKISAFLHKDAPASSFAKQFVDYLVSDQGQLDIYNSGMLDINNVYWQNPFADVHESDWFYNDVMYVSTHGLMNGTAANKFSPDDSLTRGMMVTILYRATDNHHIGGFANPFSDVAEGQYYTDAVVWAAANGIVSGYGDGRFGPNDPITRQDLAVILARYAEFNGMTLPEVRAYPGFGDESNIANYAKAVVETLYKAGIINGKGNNLFDPQGTATRAEAAAMPHRFLTQMIQS